MAYSYPQPRDLDPISGAFRLEKKHRERVAVVCQQTGLSVGAVINACIDYGMAHLSVQPITRLELVFDPDDGEEETP